MPVEPLGTDDPAGEAPALPILMGVLNITPDSFSDGGRYLGAEAAIAHGRKLAAQGAGIVDVGGESTRPGAKPVPREEEQRRAIPVVRELAAAGIRTSIDTLHAESARAAVEAGAAIINDVSGATYDPAMLDTAAWASGDHGTRLILSHWRGIPDPEYLRSDYADVVVEVRDALAELAEAAIRAGVDPAHIIVDPGLGFDKTAAQSWRLLAEIDALQSLGYPVLVGTSRKRMIADALARTLAPGEKTTPDDRDLATSVSTALAARAGVWGVRVHDVVGSVQALAVVRAWGAAGSATTMETATQGDRITLTGLEVFAHHGVFEFERERGQRFLVDAELTVDLRGAAERDELHRTVHYGELSEAILAAVQRDPVDLIETVAERVAGVALGFPGVAEARITIHKPDAPIDAEFSDVSVTVVRRS